MTKIVSTPNCGNSPKMEFLKQFNIAVTKGDLKFIDEKVTDEIEYHIIGKKKITGKINFIKEIENQFSKKIKELVIEQILSHGKEGASHGIMKMEDGKNHAFSNFYKFNNAKGEKIKSITNFTIQLKNL